MLTLRSHRYKIPLLLLLTGIWSAASAQSTQAGQSTPPEENRFTKTILTNDLNEPMELAVAPDGRVFFTERKGGFYMYDPKTRATRLVREFPVYWETKYGNGLIGLALDPKFAENRYIYFYNTPISDTPKQQVSRFRLNDDGTLDLASEKVIIEIPIDYEISRHTGGSLAFDPQGNLYISTGDNTSPFASSGYSPLDERPGRELFDDQRSAGNTNDLRGKILRIKPLPEGGYAIPEGNLFPKGTPATKPEIYAMGCRNPYRITIDPATSYLYWGEIGPDAGKDSIQGPRGYDEFNQARKAGNFGWPYFIGPNIPYHDFNFATNTVGARFDPASPVNDSPNNTGIQNLPPAQPAMIWYPYAQSPDFPELGTGGRSAIAGPVYHFDAASSSKVNFPAHYDKVLFITEWMRNWVFAVHFDEQYKVKKLEPFMSLTGDFRRPIDMEFGPDGAMYILEYGSVYGIDNEDARLVRIDYNPGNRAPVARVTARDTIGLAPLTVAFSSSKSYDYDKDKLQYEWRFEGGKVASTEVNPTYTFRKNGIYPVTVKITDPAGASGVDTLLIRVGNTLPQVAINTTSNSTFYFDNAPLVYSVKVKDNEDKVIDPKKVKVKLSYIPKLAGQEPLIGHQEFTDQFDLGRSLMAKSDCKACHQVDKPSVGPAFADVSRKYRGDKSALSRLANKVITGGGGVWGEVAMNAHPQLSRDESTEIVKYVLSLGDQQAQQSLPAQGSKVLKEHIGQKEQGVYILTASYTDKGGAIQPLTSSTSLILRPATVEAEEADTLYQIRKQRTALSAIKDQSYFMLRNIDLKGIQKLTYRYSSPNKDAKVEVHTGSPTGPVISTFDLKPTGDWKEFKDAMAPLKAPAGKHNLYFVFVRKEEPDAPLASVDWVRFER
ncbi:PQQ-dependent sugar dehydrogenase [Telluribacter humicola]|uniref:PQQ-dependent sugar dehydrogenase n=1 Tax=Telluribacter humicola TaxID=1720261 RepID=UPI001A95ADEA|nr:PQQ-dependent sugar dehydrogenase [Telluribacter humicola]